MLHEGNKIFDENKVFESYCFHRHRSDSPNETLEKPVFLEMLDNTLGKRILDLGCGDAIFGLELLKAGCQSYLGLESSHKMVQMAQTNLKRTSGNVIHSKIEDWHYPVNKFDLVVSRLALHYVADLDETFSKVSQTLRKDGQFTFSIVHPVITSSDKSRKNGGLRQDWNVDDYFTDGLRKVRFMGEFVEQYHRTIETLFKSLQDANFQIEQLRESCPQIEYFADRELYRRRKRIPLFLFLSGRKK